MVTPFPEAPGPGEVTTVAKGVLWARLPLPMALDHVNIYLFEDADGWTAIDTGIGTKRSKAAWQALLDGPLAGKPVVRVIVTHHHPDHMGLAGWFQTDHGAELICTRTAWLFARMLTLDEQPQVAPETEAFWRSAGMAPEVLEQRLAERPFNFADVVAPLPLGFTRIAEGDVIRFGGRDWDVRIGNGHAPEQATLWSRDDDLVLGADQLLPSISPNIGVYATEPEADPLSDWFDSCQRFADLAEERHFVLPGHKLPFTGLPLRVRQLEDNHHGALARLRGHLATPQTAGDCFLPLFKREIGGSAYGLALVEAVAHLNHLMKRGELRRWRRDDGAWLWQAL
ncbi:MBL fold metallo-hydrolase [Fluviibacterium sp. DFM31]|uniref:MBL fold metallo-hydrolase n=1 Tax=Meridianimarinicoccus marinus TaxID=3231483 RepID=A0ABV3L299_9RHOB